MLTAYISAAMHRARYEILPDGEGFLGSIDGLQGGADEDQAVFILEPQIRAGCVSRTVPLTHLEVMAMQKRAGFVDVRQITRCFILFGY